MADHHEPQIDTQVEALMLAHYRITVEQIMQQVKISVSSDYASRLVSWPSLRSFMTIIRTL